MIANRVRNPAMAALLCCLAAAACSGHPDSGPVTDTPQASARDASGLRILDGTEMASGSLRLQRITHTDGEVLEIHADEIRELTTLYLSLDLQAPQARLLADVHPRLDGLSPLSLAIIRDGELQFGWTMLPDGAAWSGDGLIASFELARLAADEGSDSDAAGTRSASKAIPAVDDLTRNARWNILTWSYQNPGDYDQNGIVSISDLTPLGQNFRATGPFDPNTALWMVDGDGNGEINLADISVIGQNFGNSVSGYDLYAVPDGNGYPDTAAARLIGSETVANSSRRAGARLSFGLTDNAALYNDRYWVVEQGSDRESALTPDWNGKWHAVMIYAQLGAFNQQIGDIIIAGGLPMLFFDTQSVNADVILFAKGQDSHGDEWTEPIVLSGVEFGCLSPKAQVIDGRPAMTFGVLATGQSWFRIAEDDEGVSWKLPRMVSNFGQFPLLLNDVDGRAVVCDDVSDLKPWLSTTDHVLFTFETALAPEGSGFFSLQNNNSFELMYTPDVGGKCFLTRVSYLPPALDQTTPVQISGDPEHTGVSLLRGNDGRLHAILRRNATDSLLLASSSDSSGATWTLPGQVATVNPSTVAATFAYGRIWASHHDGSTQRIMLSPAELSQPWQDLGGISSQTQPGGTLLMTTVRRHPAIVFPIDNAGMHELWYSIWY